jgi:hypothetical protein
MNCHEFDQGWNEILDSLTATWDRGVAASRPGASPSVPTRTEQAVREHASGCDSCRMSHTRFESLRHALEAWLSDPRTLPSPPEDLVERILAASELGSAVPSNSRLVTDRSSRSWLTAGSLALAIAAAGVFLMIAPTIRDLRRDRGGNRLATNPAITRSARSSPSGVRNGWSQGLSESFASATAATWDLARSTSEPAARLGREVLEAAAQSSDPAADEPSLATGEGPLGPGLVSLPSVLRGAPDPPGSALLQEIGERLSASVGPISSTARQAFGFLRTPSLEKQDKRISQPASKGA